MEILLTVRITGCICIGLASWFVGMELEQRLKQKWLFLKEMKELLAFLEKEMTYRRSTAETALETAAGNCRTCLRELLLSVSEKIRQRSGADFQTIWEEQVRLMIPERMLEKEQYQAVCEAASALCQTDTVMQRRMIETQNARFLQLCEQAQQNFLEKSRLYRRLSTAAGVFLMILLI